MKRKNISLLALFLIVAGCSIIEDEYLDELPADVKISKIELVYRSTAISSYEEKALRADIIYSANQAVINWPQGVDVFFYNKDATKTVYQLNSNGFADKITTTFADGTIMEDVLTYNTNKQVTELTNSFFKDNLKLFYKNSMLDSVVKTRTVNNVTQKGFYKRVGANAFISIFPHDNTKAYDKTLSSNLGCSSGGSLPANMNTFNKAEYDFSPLPPESGYRVDDREIKINYQVRTSTTNCTKYFSHSLYSYLNYYKKPYSYYFYFNECSISCGNVNVGYLNSYTILPALVPDYLSLYMLTVESELEWIVNNAAKENAEWQIGEIRYSYQPVSK